MKLSNEYKVFARIPQVLCVRDENVMEAKSEPIKRQKADPIKWDSRTNLDLVSYFFLSFIFPFVTHFLFFASLFPFSLCIIMLERLYVYYIDHQRRNWNILSRRERERVPPVFRSNSHTQVCSSFTTPLIEGLDMLLYLLQTLLQSRSRAKRNPPQKKYTGDVKNYI